jgi:hypothetical protein
MFEKHLYLRQILAIPLLTPPRIKNTSVKTKTIEAENFERDAEFTLIDARLVVHPERTRLMAEQSSH